MALDSGVTRVVIESTRGSNLGVISQTLNWMVLLRHVVWYRLTYQKIVQDQNLKYFDLSLDTSRFKKLT